LWPPSLPPLARRHRLFFFFVFAGGSPLGASGRQARLREKEDHDGTIERFEH
jgi:hypothetical protein